MHLAKRLNEELAQQTPKEEGSERTLSPEPELRSKSYDNRTSETQGKGKQFFFVVCRIIKNCFNYDILFMSIYLTDLLCDKNIKIN